MCTPRYRGLKSLRTSPWDTKENLPADYSRIFQFADFRRTKKRVFGEAQDDGAQVGLGLILVTHV